MKNSTLAAALACVLAASPAVAQQQSSALEQIRRDIDELGKRLEQVERDNERLEAENAALKAQNERLEATTDYLRSNTQATRKEMAEDAIQIDKIPALEKSAKSSEWASKLAWKGDFRYRHENTEAEPAADQTRHRIRARFGLTAKVNETVSATLQLATDGGNGDPRSTNQTLGEGNSRKGIGLDLAYAEWKPVEGFGLQLGKTPYSFQRVGSYFWDSDITWEGANVKFDRGPFFASAFANWLQESSSASDANFVGGQLGFKGDAGPAKLMFAAGYYDVGAVQNEITTTVVTTCSANNAFFGGPQGNLTYTGAGCARLLNDFNLIELLAQADFKLGTLPLTVFVDYIRNTEADDEDTGYSAGVTLGKASDKNTWEIGYVYQDMEKDAQFGQFFDSDFGGGITGADGSVVKVAYAPARSWTLNGQYFMNDRRTGNSITAPELDFRRLQLDLNYKF